MIIADKYEYTFPNFSQEEIDNADTHFKDIYRLNFDGSTLPDDVKQILREMALDEIAYNTQCGKLNDACIADIVYYFELFYINGNMTQIKVVAELIVDRKKLIRNGNGKYCPYIAASDPFAGDFVNISAMCISYAALDVTITEIGELKRIFGYFDCIKKKNE